MKKGLFAVFGAIATAVIVVMANSAIATTPATLPAPVATPSAPESAMIAAPPASSSETLPPSTTASTGSEDCALTGTCPNGSGSESGGSQVSNSSSGKLPEHSRTTTPVSGKPLPTAIPTKQGETKY